MFHIISQLEYVKLLISKSENCMNLVLLPFRQISNWMQNSVPYRMKWDASMQYFVLNCYKIYTNNWGNKIQQFLKVWTAKTFCHLSFIWAWPCWGKKSICTLYRITFTPLNLHAAAKKENCETVKPIFHWWSE